MKINKRLKRLSSYIEDNSNVIDVGCDHALLGIFLVKNKKNIKVIASDINKGPLEQAKKNIDKYGLNEFIKIKLGDGISTIEDYINTIVISGMGGLNIIEILKNDNEKLSNIKRIILSPNNSFKEVREFTLKLGYKIICEEIVLDRDKFYPIMILEKGKTIYNLKELLFGYNIVKNNDSKAYYDYLIDVYTKRLKSIPNRYIQERKELNEYITYLKK